MGIKYIYSDEKSIREIDKVLILSSKVLQTDSVVINDKKNVPPIVGVALKAGGTAVATGIGTGVAAIIGAPVLIFAGASFMIFKNKKKKELHNMRLARYKEAVEKQNKVIKKFMDLDEKREENEKVLKEDIEKLKKENTNLRNKLNELKVINESLLIIIEGLGKDLQVA